MRAPGTATSSSIPSRWARPRPAGSAEYPARFAIRKGNHILADRGYGYAVFGDRYTTTPELGLANGARDYSLGWRFGLARGGPAARELRLEATRREPANDHVEAEHGIGLRATARR